VNGTLASKDQILSGTPTTPTLLKYGIVRSKLTDNSTRDNAIATSDNQTDFGLELSWRGSKIEASEKGPSTPYHYVTFQFSTSENVFNVELRDEQTFFQKCTAVLTLFLSVMGALRTMKCAGEKILDTSIVLVNQKFNKKIPEDVLRRKRILDEHVLTKEGTRRLSMMVGDGSEKPQKQRRLSSRELMSQVKGKPQKQRRLSSRELMKLKKDDAIADEIGIEMTEFGFESSNTNEVFSNPMRKAAAGSGRRRHLSTSLSAFEQKTVQTKGGGGGQDEMEQKMRKMELKLEEQSRQSNKQMKEQSKQSERIKEQSERIIEQSEQSRQSNKQMKEQSERIKEQSREIEQMKEQIKLLVAASRNATMDRAAVEEDDSIEYFHDEESNRDYYIDGDGGTHWKE